MSSYFDKTVVVRKPSGSATGCMRVFFGLFFLAGAFFFYTATLHPMLQAALSLRWVETPCVVDSSRVVAVHSRRGSPTYYVEVLYHYDFKGVGFSSKRYQFTSAATAGRDRKQRIVAQYPPRRQTVCYVNPDKPAEAVISRDLNVEMAFGCFALPFLLIGGFGLFYAPRLSNQQSTSQKNAVPTFTPANAEPVRLKSQLSPLGKFFGVLAFALFWNGFMGLFAYLVFLSPNHGSVPFLAKAFVGLFCFIGLLILAASVGAFLALFNPRILLSARSNAVALGGVFQFDWSVRGRADKFRKIRIVLEGREVAVSSSGKSVQSTTQTFAEIPVVETMDHEGVSQGQGRVTVPAGLMHSFRGRHNRIVWLLRVRGELSHGAPAEEDYPITVLPRGNLA